MSHSLPSAYDLLPELRARFLKKQLCIFLDYDGTMTSIVPDPESAYLSSSARELLALLAQQLPVTVISGRDIKTLLNFIQLPQLNYVGDHGLDIQFEGQRFHPPELFAILPTLLQVRAEIKTLLADIKNIKIEDKTYSTGVHYRNVDPCWDQEVVARTEQLVKNYPELRLVYGKRVLDIFPNLTWDKGQAMLWVLDRLQAQNAEYFTLYLGDDLTDENAFRVMPKAGAGILVGGHTGETCATYWLKDPDEVKAFLLELSVPNLK
ncbi:MAG: trehalose-phosphatase [Gammaproteobacteria bacterium]